MGCPCPPQDFQRFLGDGLTFSRSWFLMNSCSSWNQGYFPESSQSHSKLDCYFCPSSPQSTGPFWMEDFYWRWSGKTRSYSATQSEHVSMSLLFAAFSWKPASCHFITHGDLALWTNVSSPGRSQSWVRGAKETVGYRVAQLLLSAMKVYQSALLNTWATCLWDDSCPT